MNLGIEHNESLSDECTCGDHLNNKYYHIYLEINKKRIYHIKQLDLCEYWLEGLGENEAKEKLKKIRKKLDNYLFIMKFLNIPEIMISYHLADFTGDWETYSILLILNDLYKFPEEINYIIYQYSQPTTIDNLSRRYYKNNFTIYSNESCNMSRLY